MIKDKRLEVLKEKQTQIEKEIKAEEKKLKDQQRKLDTRRKIIAGGIFLSKIKKGDKMLKEIFEEEIKNTREKDRVLFD